MAEAQVEAGWYEVVEGDELEQGDIVLDYPVSLVSNADSDDAVDLRVERRRVIVLTQTCDIPKAAQGTLLLAEITEYDSIYRDNNGDVRSSGFRKSLVDGTQIALFLLHERVQEPSIKWSLVSFRNIYVAPKDDVIRLAASAGVRLRLRSPYKEHLAQSFAKFMMRVGLPETAHDFRKYSPAV